MAKAETAVEGFAGRLGSVTVKVAISMLDPWPSKVGITGHCQMGFGIVVPSTET
jgi:hypothetical protein